jgi:hypothetical protein
MHNSFDDASSVSRLSIATTNSSTSSRSIYHNSDDVFFNPRFSIATTNSSISNISHVFPLKPSKHDPQAGLWNGVLRVIPCGKYHNLMRWNDLSTNCPICGFSQWHALMLHAGSMGLGAFVTAMHQLRLRDVGKFDYAGNSPIHFLMSAGVSSNYHNSLLRISESYSQNVFGQNPLHVLSPQDLGDELIAILEQFKGLGFPPGVLLTQRDIYCRSPLYCLLQHPLERSLYQKVLNIFPFAEQQIRSFDTSGTTIIGMMSEATYRIQSESLTDFRKIQDGIIEIKKFLYESKDTLQRYDFQDIARGARGTKYLGFYQCLVCGQTNAHSDSYLDQIKCAGRSGRDRNRPDETGTTPAHALVSITRCNIDGTPETASETALLLCALIPPNDPTLLEALHALDPKGNSLVYNIAVRGFDEILEYVLALETPGRRQAMVNSCYRKANGTEGSVLQAVLEIIRAVRTETLFDKFKRITALSDTGYHRFERCRDILIKAGAQLTPNIVTRFRIDQSTPIQVINITGGVSFEDTKETDTKDGRIAVEGMRVEDVNIKKIYVKDRHIVREPVPTTSTHHGPAEWIQVEAQCSGDSKAHNHSTISGTSPTMSENSTKPAVQAVKIKQPMRLFPIDARKDADLISAWKDNALPIIQSLICTQNDSSISISLLRRGETLDNSYPVVRIQTSVSRSEDQQAEINAAISNLLLPVPVLSVFFVTGSVRRTARRSDLDVAPCSARNTDFSPRPPMGVSIGVGSSVRDTATLGGYVYVDKDPYILTVHHLFTDDETGTEYGPGTSITQPSLQEAKEFGEVWNEIRSSGDPFHLTCVKAVFEKIRACLPAVSFGTLTHSSGFRNRRCRDGPSNVEMDWAICKVELNRKGSNVTPCDNHWCRDTSPIVPGGTVFAVGRTSGHQTGIVNGCTTTLIQQNGEGVSRESEEWAIIRSSTTTESSWASGGIGTYGDSGSWILETATDNVLGQLWGRDYHEGEDEGDGDIITYFSPIHDIFDDIRELTGAKQVSLCTSRDSMQLDAPEGHTIVSGVIPHFTYPPSPSENRCRICNLSVPTEDAEKSLMELENEINLLKVVVEDIKTQLLLGSPLSNTPGSVSPSRSSASTTVSTPT